MNNTSHYVLLPPYKHDFHIGFQAFKELTTMRPHWHEHLELLYVTRGTGTFIVNGERIYVLPNDLVIAEPNSPHVLLSDSGIDYECLLIRTDLFTPDELQEMNFLSHIRTDPTVTELFSEIRNEFSIGGSVSNMRKKALAFSLIVYLIRTHSAPLITKEDKESRLWVLSRIKIIEQYVSENYKNKIAISDLARLLYVSESHFCRFFKKAMGISAIEYLNVFRIGKAEQLLRETELSITEVASLSGFENSNYFSRLFRRIMKQTPSEYRCSKS